MKLARPFASLALCVAAAATAQDATIAFPHNYKLILDNADVAVLRVHYGPHEKVGVHDHSAYSTVYVYLNNSGPVRFNHDEEEHPFDADRPPTHTGAFRVSPGRIERHWVENLSDLPSDYLRIELKKFPVRTLKEEFRGPAPAQPLAPGRTIAYNNPALRIERIVCAPNSPCTLAAEPAPSVIVPIPDKPLSAQAFDRAPEAATWLAAGKPLAIDTAGTSAPIQILRVALLRQ